MTSSSKISVRKKMISKRDSFPAVQRQLWPSLAVTHLENFPTWSNANVIGCYIPHGSEANAVSLVEHSAQRGAKIVYPRVKKKHDLPSLAKRRTYRIKYWRHQATNRSSARNSRGRYWAFLNTAARLWRGRQKIENHWDALKGWSDRQVHHTTQFQKWPDVRYWHGWHPLYIP